MAYLRLELAPSIRDLMSFRGEVSQIKINIHLQINLLLHRDISNLPPPLFLQLIFKNYYGKNIKFQTDVRIFLMQKHPKYERFLRKRLYKARHELRQVIFSRSHSESTSIVFEGATCNWCSEGSSVVECKSMEEKRLLLWPAWRIQTGRLIVIFMNSSHISHWNMRVRLLMVFQ